MVRYILAEEIGVTTLKFSEFELHTSVKVCLDDQLMRTEKYISVRPSNRKVKS